MSVPTLLNTNELKKAALHFRAVNHILRQKILRLIHQNGRIPVTSIYQKLDIDQPVASQHLAILRRSSLVKTEREGKQILYSINHDSLELLHNTAVLLNENLLLTAKPTNKV